MSNVVKNQRTQKITSITFAYIAGSVLLNACSVSNGRQNPCELANRGASFSILLENSMSNAYNACLEEKRSNIVGEWWKN
jgi:hypothetical protein